MHSFIIIGGTTQKRQERLKRLLAEAKIAPQDTVTIIPQEEHITINNVREFQKRLLLAPVQSPYTAGIIEDAHLLTVQAQQALLKLLEEPPPRARIFVETESADQLLPTIVSRCEIIRLVNKAVAINTDALTMLMNGKPSDVFIEVDKHTSDREEAKQWARELLDQSRALLLSEPSKKNTRVVRRLLQAQAHLAVNCNPKLVLDRVFLSLS